MKTAFIIVPTLLAALATSTPLGLSANHGGDFCASRYDGKYAMGCGSFLASCTSYLSIVMVCPKRTCFDDKTKKCMDKCMCKGVGTTEAPCETTTEPALEPSQVPSTELPHETTPTPCEPEPSLFCKERADGDYSIGCTSAYISCVDGKAIARECPSSLVLDEAANVCVARAYALSCNGKPTTTPLITTTETPRVETTEEPGKEPTEGCKVETTEAPKVETTEGCKVETTEEPGKEPPTTDATTEGHCGTDELSTPLPTVDPELVVFCKGREDGDYNLGCQSVFIACNNQKVYLMKCPDDLVLDMNSNMCVGRAYASVCGGKPTETSKIDTTESPKVETTEEPGKEPTEGCKVETTVAPKVVTTEAPEVETTEGCKVDTTEEPGKEPTTTEATTEGHCGTDEPSTPLPTVDPELVVFCKDREDGYYNLGCQSVFIACTNNKAYLLKCPDDLVLDMNSNMCVGRAYAQVCGGKPTEAPKVETTAEPGKEPTEGCKVETTEAPEVETTEGCKVDTTEAPKVDTTEAPKVETTEAPKVETTAEPGKEPTECATSPTEGRLCSQGDGFYSLGKTQWYVKCTDGHPTYHLCECGFTFDHKKNMCTKLRVRGKSVMKEVGASL